jgi:hypothetical protein
MFIISIRLFAKLKRVASAYMEQERFIEGIVDLCENIFLF